MKAAYYETTGPARDVLRVGEVATPKPHDGEVRVCLHATGLNPVDGYARAGVLGPLPFPRSIPGFDGAGANFKLDAVVLAVSGVITAYGSPGNFAPRSRFSRSCSKRDAYARSAALLRARRTCERSAAPSSRATHPAHLEAVRAR